MQDGEEVEDVGQVVTDILINMLVSFFVILFVASAVYGAGKFVQSIFNHATKNATCQPRHKSSKEKRH